MVVGYKLTYPSGTATAMLINSFHTNTGAELARQGSIIMVISVPKFINMLHVWASYLIDDKNAKGV